MDALVMAGGKASRMGGEEKSLLTLKGRPMISYVLDTLLKSRSIKKIYVAVSPNVPLTAEFLKNCPGITIVMTPGSGYIEDTAYAARISGWGAPFLVISADLPLVRPDIINRVVSAYDECGKEALSVRVLAGLVQEKPDIILTDTPEPTIPAGINVINGAHMDRLQDEYVLVLDDPALTVNVNYRKDLTYCERLLKV
jgi:adenosylcobinamide-phosphate guanylyltransferase